MRLRSWPGSLLFCALQLLSHPYSTSLASLLDTSCFTVIFLNIWTSRQKVTKSLWQLVKLAWSPQAGCLWLYSQLCSSVDGGERCGSCPSSWQWCNFVFFYTSWKQQRNKKAVFYVRSLFAMCILSQVNSLSSMYCILPHHACSYSQMHVWSWFDVFGLSASTE